MDAGMTTVRINTQGYQHGAIEKTRYDSSSILWTTSAVIGRMPRDTTKPFCFCSLRDRWPFPASVNDRFNNWFRAALMLQASAFARDFALAYNSGSRFTVSLIR